MLGKETTETKTVFPDSFMQNYKKEFREKLALVFDYSLENDLFLV